MLCKQCYTVIKVLLIYITGYENLYGLTKNICTKCFAQFGPLNEIVSSIFSLHSMFLSKG